LQIAMVGGLAEDSDFWAGPIIAFAM